MKFESVLSRTTTDQIKSKIMSPDHAQIVLDVYMTPREYAELLEKYFEDSFLIEITSNKTKSNY